MVRSAARRPSFSLSSSPTLFHPDPGSSTISLLSFRFFLPPSLSSPVLDLIQTPRHTPRNTKEKIRERRRETLSGRNYDRWCNAMVNRQWKWASRDFRRIKIIIRRKRVEWVKTGRLNGKDRLARGPRFAARLFFPRIVEKTLGPRTKKHI